MREEIILIGPMGVGKSHISELLSQKLGKPHLSVDYNRFHYYEQIGYDYELAEKIKAEKGLLKGIYEYWKPFELYAIERILNEFSDCIFDFGAGHSVYDGDKFEKAKEILSDFKNIIFLLPSKNECESLKFLMERKNIESNDTDGIERLNYFITHRSNYDLCKHIVYVKDKSADDICDEIIHITT